MKTIRFKPHVQAEIRPIERDAAFQILKAIDRYARAGSGHVKRLVGKFEGLLRLPVGQYRIFFDETADTLTIHRVRNRCQAYRRDI